MRNESCYYDFIRELRNHPEVQGGFIEWVEITPEQQSDYMSKYADHYCVCLVDGKPAGYIGEIEGDLRVATHPSFQGKGVGNFMVREFCKNRPGCFAKVKVENTASLKLFRKAGFEERFVIMFPANPVG